ncbi:MAG: DUF2784 domain-containing protein [Hyphomicrobiales bacterium]|nr:DUF2784 domain-containing protein [Hyphomicrobiales bacterium]MCP5370895.1 DUF2784 domain-containing protein [Hyphomicrobiales bacterium]
MDPGLLADIVGAVHFLFVLFVVLGLAAVLVGWAAGWGWTRNIWFRLGHLAAIAFVVVQSWMGQMCPLTIWENDLRHLARQEGVGTSFIETWLNRLLYYQGPTWVFTTVYTVFGALVLVTVLAYPPRRGN